MWRVRNQNPLWVSSLFSFFTSLKSPLFLVSISVPTMISRLSSSVRSAAAIGKVVDQWRRTFSGKQMKTGFSWKTLCPLYTTWRRAQTHRFCSFCSFCSHATSLSTRLDCLPCKHGCREPMDALGQLLSLDSGNSRSGKTPLNQKNTVTSPRWAWRAHRPSAIYLRHHSPNVCTNRSTSRLQSWQARNINVLFPQRQKVFETCFPPHVTCHNSHEFVHPAPCWCCFHCCTDSLNTPRIRFHDWLLTSDSSTSSESLSTILQVFESLFTFPHIFTDHFPVSFLTLQICRNLLAWGLLSRSQNGKISATPFPGFPQPTGHALKQESRHYVYLQILQ